MCSKKFYPFAINGNTQRYNKAGVRPICPKLKLVLVVLRFLRPKEVKAIKKENQYRDMENKTVR